MRGYTLVELLVTLALAAMVLVLGGAGLRQVMATGQRTAATDLYSDLQYARGLAIASNQRVSVCNSADALSCRSPAQSDWAAGWLVYLNPGAASTPAASSAVLRSHDALAGGYSLKAVSVIQAGVDFLPEGRARLAGSVKLCNSDASLPGRQIAVSASGMVTLDEVTCP